MQILISCAKDMSSQEEVMRNYEVSEEEMMTWPTSHPLFMEEAVSTAREMSVWSVEEIAHVMKCSDDIAEMNQMRFNQFAKTVDERLLLQAGATYSGIAFKHLRFPSMTKEEMLGANTHLWIMSFMYGLLRPLDLILPYRMEGQVKLKVHQMKSMFDWWKDKLTSTLLQSINEDDGTLLWCSTEEMKRMVDWKRLIREVNVIEPDFLVNKGGKMKSMSVYAKMCRGAMARQALIKENEESLSDFLIRFQYEGFQLVEVRKGDTDLRSEYIYIADK